MNLEPMRPHTVVVAIDGSEESRRALGRAADLANVYGAKLVVAHAAPVPPNADEMDFIPFERAVEKAGIELLRDARESVQLPANRVVTRLVRGEPAPAICELAREVDAGLVVVGSRGLGSVSRMLLGSVSDRLLHTCDRPVLVSR